MSLPRNPPCADRDRYKIFKRDGGTKWGARFKIQKLDDERQMFFGQAYVSTDAQGRIIVDHDDEVIPPSELEKAAYDHVLNHRRAGEMHENHDLARMVESIVFTPEKRAALSLPESGEVSWWVGFVTDDAAVWKKVKDGTYPEFSIEGRARKVPHPDIPNATMLLDLEIDEVDLVDKGAGIGVKVLLVKRACTTKEKSMDPKLLNKTMTNILKQISKKKGDAITKMLGEECKEKLAKTEVLTLTDVESALTPELWAIVLQAIDAAAMVPASPEPPEAVEAAGDPEDPDEEEEPAAKTEDEEEEPGPKKGLAVRAATEKHLRDELAKQREENEATRKRMAAIEDERAFEKKRHEIASTGLKFLPGDDDEVARALIALERIEKGIKPDFKAIKPLFDVLRRAAAAIQESGMFETFGKIGGDKPGSDDPEAEFEVAAKELAKEKDLSLTSARTQIMRKNPDLYKRVKKAQDDKRS